MTITITPAMILPAPLLRFLEWRLRRTPVACSSCVAMIENVREVDVPMTAVPCYGHCDLCFTFSDSLRDYVA